MVTSSCNKWLRDFWCLYYMYYVKVVCPVWTRYVIASMQTCMQTISSIHSAFLCYGIHICARYTYLCTAYISVHDIHICARLPCSTVPGLGTDMYIGYTYLVPPYAQCVSAKFMYVRDVVQNMVAWVCRHIQYSPWTTDGSYMAKVIFQPCVVWADAIYMYREPWRMYMYI